MGKRSRNRDIQPLDQAAPELPVTAREPSGKKELPPAPWGSFPLVELLVLAGIGLIVAGFIKQDRTGMAMVLVGLVFGSVAGFEVALREHLSGYRSHSLVLAGTLASVVLVVTFLLRVNYIVMLSLSAAAFLAGSSLLHRVYRKRFH